MKRTTGIIAAAAAGVLALGCHLRPPTTEVTASDFDLTPLVGKWTGEYNSEDTGRSGDISFVLRAGEVSAFGIVQMVAREPETAAAPADRMLVNNRLSVPTKQVLTIHFVRKQGKGVVGLLDPYTDPDCACRVTTSFQGVFTDSGTIEGTFTTISSELAHITSGGQWKVTRAKRL